MTKHRRERGFTLVELLVAISLMIVLVGSMVMIFTSSVATVKISEARIKIQNTVRACFDHIWRDTSSMLPMDGGLQRFWMNDDGFYPSSNSLRHVNEARDSMGFRALVPVNGALTPVRIIYRLVYDADPFNKKAVRKVVNGVWQAKEVKLYVLRKEMLDLKGNPLKDLQNRVIPPLDLCYYVTSFNLEFMASLNTLDKVPTPANPPTALDQFASIFQQIAPDVAKKDWGPFPGPKKTSMAVENLAPVTDSDEDGFQNPMGQPDGKSDTGTYIINDIPDLNGPQPVPGQPTTGIRFVPRFIVPAIRVTIRVVEDVEVRQERVYSKVFVLPTG